MNKKSAYVTNDIFTDWLKNHFAPRKPQGKTMLLLDGHASHMSIGCLEFAAENDIYLICFPSHTTHYLQPLDRSYTTQPPWPAPARYRTHTPFLTQNEWDKKFLSHGRR